MGARVRGGGVALTLMYGHCCLAVMPIVGGGAENASGGGGAMAGPRRDRIRRSWSCGANGGK